MSSVTFAGLSLEKPRIFGIINVTPDSFSDGGDALALEDALRRGKAMLDAGRAVREYVARGIVRDGRQESPREDSTLAPQGALYDTDWYVETAVLNLQTQVLANYPVELVYRYVVAVRRTDLEKK